VLDGLHPPARFRAVAPPPLPVEAAMLGRTVEEVAGLMPRLFNLCRTAQSAAIRLALGLEALPVEDLAREIREEHLLRLSILLPAQLGLPALPLPQRSRETLAAALFAGAGFPRTPEGFESFLHVGQGLAPLFAALRDRFAPGEAGTTALPVPTEATVLGVAALENSPAARHLDHPVLRGIEARYGRGPYWRVAARAIDLDAALAGKLPAPRRVAPGAAVVPAARGLYAVRVRVEAGRVVALTRVTPTDHMLALGGMMEQSLASLSGAREDRARLVAEILDPCVPVRLRRVEHA